MRQRNKGSDLPAAQPTPARRRSPGWRGTGRRTPEDSSTARRSGSRLRCLSQRGRWLRRRGTRAQVLRRQSSASTARPLAAAAQPRPYTPWDSECRQNDSPGRSALAADGTPHHTTHDAPHLRAGDGRWLHGDSQRARRPRERIVCVRRRRARLCVVGSVALAGLGGCARRVSEGRQSYSAQSATHLLPAPAPVAGRWRGRVPPSPARAWHAPRHCPYRARRDTRRPSARG
jgi:hypothetical protein